jgi:prepilin-type N-terminal cleavage/methylation domain-containing protein
MSKTIRTIKKSGFTLIELLIVIGLLAALASVILPSLMGDREKALSNIDKYNGAGYLRTLRHYQAVTGGALPDGFHTGLTTNASGASLMLSVTPTFAKNVKSASVVQLSAEEVQALTAAGIANLAYGTGEANGHNEKELYGYESVSASGSYAIAVDEDWVDVNGNAITFNGKGLHYYMGHENYSNVFAFFLAPTVNWEGTGTGWVKGFEVGMDVIARSPIVDGDFPYYIAYVGIQSGIKMELVSNLLTTGGAAVHFHLPPPKNTVDEAYAALQEEVEELDSTATWNWVRKDSNGKTETVDTDFDSTSSEFTVTATPSAGTVSGTITFTISNKPIVTARLLGTSAPNCVSTNP